MCPSPSGPPRLGTQTPSTFWGQIWSNILSAVHANKKILRSPKPRLRNSPTSHWGFTGEGVRQTHPSNPSSPGPTFKKIPVWALPTIPSPPRQGNHQYLDTAVTAPQRHTFAAQNGRRQRSRSAAACIMYVIALQSRVAHARTYPNNFGKCIHISLMQIFTPARRLGTVFLLRFNNYDP